MVLFYYFFLFSGKRLFPFLLPIFCVSFGVVVIFVVRPGLCSHGSCSRSDYYLTDAEMYERSGGRRSSLYEGDNNDPPGEFNRSAYGFNTSRSVFVMHNRKITTVSLSFFLHFDRRTLVLIVFSCFFVSFVA